MDYKNFYYKEVVPELQKALKMKNVFAVPRVEKIIVNVGCGEASTNKNAIEHVSGDIVQITGQKPLVTKAHRAVSAFKIRRGLPIGVKVTMRGNRMYFFLEKLLKVVLPRIKDFRGIPVKNFDGRGNLNIGLSDQTLFPEIEYDKIDKIRGLEITIVTTAQDDDSAKALLEKMGLVFQKITD